MVRVSERGQSELGLDTAVTKGVVQQQVVRWQARAIIFGVPEMQHRGGKSSILAPRTTMHEPKHEVGVFPTPPAECRVETIDAQKVCAANRQIGAADASPCCAPQTT
jgi:hypothetical protein